MFERLISHLSERLKVRPLGTRMPGPRLPERIRSIVEEHLYVRISRTRAACIVASCAVICSAFLAVTLTHAQSTDMDWEKTAGGKMAFDIASVKQDPATMDRKAVHSNVDLDSGDSFSPTGGLFSATHFPLVSYIGFAFKLRLNEELQLQSQMPKWATTNRYDIEGRTAGNPTKDQYRLMVQTVLADRFKLVFHVVTSKSPILTIVPDKPGKLGPQLHPHTDEIPCPSGPSEVANPPTVAGGFPSSCGVAFFLPSPTRGRIRVGGRDVLITDLTDVVSVKGLMSSDKQIVDGTGLGKVDFLIEFAPDVPPGAEPKADADGPTFLEALKDQLGLKLTPAIGNVSAFVIDHVEEPTAN